ncbi:MAG: heavy metal translocating P-type ATPase [Azonexus sp.]|nr:heavy metal translocating P-type ATPase [Azonexus sp.]MCK6411009.1 heavy metal translocating P-type ATPase [Azonexus sp.]
MTSSPATPPFAALWPVHRLADRVRFRYRAETPVDAEGVVRAARNLHGVRNVRLNPAARSLAVDFDPAETDAARLRAALLGLDLTGSARVHDGVDHRDGLLGVAASGALLLGQKLVPAGLMLPATLAVALPVFSEAVEDLRTEGITSHVLEALAVAISTLRRDFTAANATSFMLALGEYLEQSIARRSDELLKELLRPDTGRVWVEIDGQERQIASAAVEVGMTVVVAAGATVPVDGTVLGGEASLNETAMTGESRPIAKKRGDQVLSGTLVEEGRLRIYAEHVGCNTAAARIADYVERSLAAKSQAQLGAARLADRLVPAVLGLAGVSWLLTGDWQRAAAVLQADYSCALKLATPVAFKAAMHRAGVRGILFKGGDIVERLAEADTFVFDKTGTLTTGQLAVTDAIAFDPQYTPKDIIDLAASVEEHYFHPLALAVVNAAKKHQGRHFDHKEVEFIAAHGVASVIDGQRIVVGSRHFVEEDEGIPIGQHRQRLEELFQQGKTLLYIGFGGRLIGVIALKDELRSASLATLRQLRALGVKRIVMLTGDHRDRAAELAEALDIDEFHAELLPQQKAELVARMKAEGARIAFVGDGINDAPALAGAHVGIAMQKGADIARLTADVALLEDGIERVAEAKATACSTMKRIESNFRLTIATNTGILAAAASGRMSPVTSSIAHNGSTIAILLNALRAA